MKKALLYALLAASVSVCVALVSSSVILTWIPKGKPRRMAERYLIAPGQLAYERLEKPRERMGQALQENLPERLERLPHLYNVGVWGLAAFALCLFMTLAFGVSSFASAVALGFKVTLTLVFLQLTLVAAGYLVLVK